jgi:hypothetical protein
MEFKLYLQGHINRSDLMEAFRVSVQQTSKDFANYVEGRNSNFTYDKSMRAPQRGKNFKHRHFQPDAEEYFPQLQAVEHGFVLEVQSWISYSPPHWSHVELANFDCIEYVDVAVETAKLSLWIAAWTRHARRSQYPTVSVSL